MLAKAVIHVAVDDATYLGVFADDMFKCGALPAYEVATEASTDVPTDAPTATSAQDIA